MIPTLSINPVVARAGTANVRAAITGDKTVGDGAAMLANDHPALSIRLLLRISTVGTIVGVASGATTLGSTSPALSIKLLVLT